MADVFVSYAREALPFVERLTAALRALNREVWVDLEEIIPTARWMQEIRAGITEADAVAFVITPDWVASKICQAELQSRARPVVRQEHPYGEPPGDRPAKDWAIRAKQCTEQALRELS